MITRILHNRIVVARGAFLSIIMMIIVLNVSVLAQSIPQCNGQAVVAETASQACGNSVSCTGSNNCTAWFEPFQYAMIDRCQSPNPPVPTAICIKSGYVECGDGGECIPGTNKTCQPVLGATKYVRKCIGGGPCYID